MEQTTWDYYDEKLLKSLVIRYTFDFKQISEFYKKNIKSKDFSEKDCREKWTELARQKQLNSSRFETLIKDLPNKRKENNYLKVTPNDLKSEKSLQSDGSYSYPNGKFFCLNLDLK